MAFPRPRTVVRVLACGPLAGALVYVGLFFWCVLVHRSAEYMGVEDSSVTDRLMQMFDDRIKAQQLGLLGLYALIGAVVGTLAGSWLELLRRVRKREFRIWRHIGLSLALIFAVHALVTMRSMALHPAMYAPATQQSLLMKVLFGIALDGPPAVTFDVILAGLGLSWLGFVAVLAARREIHPAWPAGLGVAVGVMVAIIAAPRRLSPEKRHPEHPNVIILAVDSMRAEVLQDRTDGGPPVVPNIRALAERATTFTRAVPTVPRTYPSWASMLTGQYPHHHGVRHMFPLEKPGRVIQHGLPDILAAAGYRTGVVSDFAGDVFARGDFGFQTVDAPPFTLASNVALGGVKLHVHLLPYLADLLPDDGGYKAELSAFERFGDPSRVADDALDFVADDPDKPFFLVAFFSAGHFPFASPTPFWKRYGGDYDGPSRFAKDSFGKQIGDAEKAHLLDLYHGAVSASDAAIGTVIDRLRAAGQLDDTVLIVTADHGENVYEYGLGIGHGDHLYARTTLEVPLLVDYPGNPARGARIATPVSLLDIAPTVLARTGLTSDAPPETLVGVDLAHSLARPIFSEIDLWFFPPETHRLDAKRIVGVEGFAGFDFDPHDYGIFLGAKYQPMANLAKHRMVLDGDRKLLYIPTRDGVRWELYDPIADPGDEHDLAAAEPATVERLKATLYAWMLTDPSTVRVGDFVVPREETRP